MKRFKVVNSKIQYMDKFGIRHFDTITVTMHQPPYENENVLYKTGWDEKDVTITEIELPEYEEEE